MKKLNDGSLVKWTKASGNLSAQPHRTMRVEGSETHNGLTFYRLAEIPGGLFLPESLKAC